MWGVAGRDVGVDSWEEPGDFGGRTHAPGHDAAITDCESVAFDPTAELEAEKAAGSSASGLETEFQVPQEGALTGTGLAAADVVDTSVTLPAGFQVNPSSADGNRRVPQLRLAIPGRRNWTQPQNPASRRRSSRRLCQVASGEGSGRRGRHRRAKCPCSRA